MQAGPASPSIPFPMDDRDLDDAELWAVIDSAAASASARIRKPLLALKHSAPAATNASPRLPRAPRHHPPAPMEDGLRVHPDGEVVQEDRWSHRRPHKMARLVAPEASPDHRMVVVRHPAPASPMPYSSPGQGRVVVKEELSPVVESPPSDRWQSEEKGSLGANGLAGRVPSTSLFKQYQNAAFEILEKTDYTVISGNPFIKKSGWRKIAFFFNLSFEIRDKSIEFDENRNVQRAEFVVRAFMQGGRFSDGWGSCERHEKRFLKPNHDIPSTAETRAKNKACQKSNWLNQRGFMCSVLHQDELFRDLLGIGEYRPGVINSHR